MVPTGGLSDHATAVLVLPVTVAENCWVCEIVSDAVAGVKETLTGEFTVRLSCSDALPYALLAVTVKLAMLDALGVPLMTPVAEFKVSPAGRVPLLTAHVMGVVPEAASACE
jgi:hypothetical protein